MFSMKFVFGCSWYLAISTCQNNLPCITIKPWCSLCWRIFCDSLENSCRLSETLFQLF